MKIDFVVTWVDNSDKKWLEDKEKYAEIADKSMNQNYRYIDHGFFKYWFRAVEKYAPWINKIYIVTCGHLPDWLDISHPKLIHIKHSDYIPNEYLPTFNSNVIELNLHRIESLSDKFVLFNDDMFLNNYVQPKDFFYNGLPRDYGIYNNIVPIDTFSNIVFNNVLIMNKHFNKKETMRKNFNKFFNFIYGKEIVRNLLTLPWNDITGYYNPHLTSSFTKKTFIDVWNLETEILEKTSYNKFREKNDVNQWLFRYWQIESGLFYPQSIKFGKVVKLENIEEVKSGMNNKKIKVLCINDPDSDLIDVKRNAEIVNEEFEKLFPDKSSFEKE